MSPASPPAFRPEHHRYQSGLRPTTKMLVDDAPDFPTSLNTSSKFSLTFATSGATPFPSSRSARPATAAKGPFGPSSALKFANESRT